MAPVNVVFVGGNESQQLHRRLCSGTSTMCIIHLFASRGAHSALCSTWPPRSVSCMHGLGSGSARHGSCCFDAQSRAGSD